MDDLTPRQRQVLEYVTSHVHQHGYPPTIREIAEEVGLASTNRVSEHLNNLARKGYLERDGVGRSRTLRVVGLVTEAELRKAVTAALAALRSGKPGEALRELEAVEGE